MKLFALLIVIFALSVGLFAVQDHPQPTVMCHPSHVNNNERCKCLSMGQGEQNCKEGKLVTETQSCSSFCFKEWCGCCAAMDALKHPPPKK